MGKMFINDTTLSSIADAIREKGGTTDAMLPGEMAGKIQAISAGYAVKNGSFKLTSAGNSVTVDGLGGTPAHVVVWMSLYPTSSIAIGSGSMIMMMSTIGDIRCLRVMGSSIYVYEQGSTYFNITPTSNGFTLKSNIGNFAATSYNYLALL